MIAGSMELFYKMLCSVWFFLDFIYLSLKQAKGYSVLKMVFQYLGFIWSCYSFVGKYLLRLKLTRFLTNMF